MKLSTAAALLGLGQLSFAAPTPTSEIEERGTIEKRAAISDAATLGYATLNGGTTGGAGGSTTTVSTLPQLTAAVQASGKAVVVVTGTISGSTKVRPTSDKTIIGKDSSAKLVGIGLDINKQKNVIVRNLGISKVIAANGDALSIQESTNVWVDHVDLSSDLDHDKDYYDGLLDITHAGDYITVTNGYLHDHFKANLIGHSDSNASEDTGHLRVTEANNYFKNIGSRAPSLRFGTGHIFNNYFENVNDGINSRQGAQILVENNVWSGSKKALYSTDAGYAVAKGNDFGGATNNALVGTINSVPYSYTLAAASSVKASVAANAGQKLSF